MRIRLTATAILLAVLYGIVLATVEECSTPSDYRNASDAHKSGPRLLPGFTRSTTRPNLYHLITPTSRVYSSPPPGWSGSVLGAAVITPALGSNFAMYLLDAKGKGSLSNAVRYKGAPPKLERLWYVLHGQMIVEMGDKKETFGAGGYVYVAPGDGSVSITLQDAAAIQIERIYGGSGKPKSVMASENDCETKLFEGEVFRCKQLLNAKDASYDFNIHVMDFAPGEYLNVKEVHYNQHGLLMLKGEGIYLLDDMFVPVSAGDVIYMAPYVLQWYGALGKEDTRYFLYKDTNVNPLV